MVDHMSSRCVDDGIPAAGVLLGGRCAAEEWSMAVSSLDATMDLYISKTRRRSNSVGLPGAATRCCFATAPQGSASADARLARASMPRTHASRARASARRGPARSTRTRRRKRAPPPERRRPTSCRARSSVPSSTSVSWPRRWYLRRRTARVDRIGNASASMGGGFQIQARYIWLWRRPDPSFMLMQCKYVRGWFLWAGHFSVFFLLLQTEYCCCETKPKSEREGRKASGNQGCCCCVRGRVQDSILDWFIGWMVKVKCRSEMEHVCPVMVNDLIASRVCMFLRARSRV
jgi:hypothetical protein